MTFSQRHTINTDGYSLLQLSARHLRMLNLISKQYHKVDIIIITSVQMGKLKLGKTI